MRTVRENEEVVCVSSQGMVVRTPVSEISLIGRNTQGVRVIRLTEHDLFVAVAVVMPKEEVEAIGDDVEAIASASAEPPDADETDEPEGDETNSTEAT